MAPAIAATAQSCMSYKATRVRARILSRLGLFCFRCWRAKHNEETRRQQTFSYFFYRPEKKLKQTIYIQTGADENSIALNFEIYRISDGAGGDQMVNWIWDFLKFKFSNINNKPSRNKSK